MQTDKNKNKKVWDPVLRLIWGKDTVVIRFVRVISDDGYIYFIYVILSYDGVYLLG